MGIRKHKATTASMRFTTTLTREESGAPRPLRSALRPKRRRGGRGAKGHITVRHRGGGHKRRYRQIDFQAGRHGVTARVAGIEYDPNRSALIARLHYADGARGYMLAPQGLRVGDRVMTGPDAEPTLGNTLPLSRIPPGATIHNIEPEPGRGGRVVRAAGAGAQLMAREGRYAHVRLPSGEIRMFDVRCQATIGRVGNAEHSSLSDGKAGRRRWRGVRPTVRGVAMNPVDHPMGGGEGRTSGGGHPVSPWGKLAKGGQTRKPRKPSNRFIVSRRK